MSDVALQISMKNYHITIGISMVRSTSTAKFVEVRCRVIGIVQEGNGDSHYQDIFRLDLGMECAPFPCVHTASGFQFLSEIVATGHKSGMSVMMRLGHDWSSVVSSDAPFACAMSREQTKTSPSEGRSPSSA